VHGDAGQHASRDVFGLSFLEEAVNATQGFAVVVPLSTHATAPRRICFSYLRDANGTRFSWSANLSGCKRDQWTKPVDAREEDMGYAGRPSSFTMEPDQQGKEDVRYFFNTLKLGENKIFSS